MSAGHVSENDRLGSLRQKDDDGYEDATKPTEEKHLYAQAVVNTDFKSLLCRMPENSFVASPNTKSSLTKHSDDTLAFGKLDNTTLWPHSHAIVVYNFLHGFLDIMEVWAYFWLFFPTVLHQFSQFFYARD